MVIIITSLAIQAIVETIVKIVIYYAILHANKIILDEKDLSQIYFMGSRTELTYFYSGHQRF